MLIKIDDIVLYSTSAGKDAEASAEAKAFLDEAGVEHLYLNYGNESVLEDAKTPLRTWSFLRDGEFTTHPITNFPLLIYTEMHDDLPPSKFPRVLLYGVDEIAQSNIAELYKLGRGS